MVKIPLSGLHKNTASSLSGIDATPTNDQRFVALYLSGFHVKGRCRGIKLPSSKCHLKWGVCIHWTGLLDWTTGLDYWTGFSQQCGLPEQRRC